ncbi:hypothetical protein [Serratia quinivorans]|uniref:hypothetical protein n=1 Tax=Serratia quinivorans TaxID=137545 RepID=UPI003F97C6F0
MNTLETLRLSRFDVVFLSKNQDNKTIKCHFITSALNSFDAAFIFGQNNKSKGYVVLSVDAIN